MRIFYHGIDYDGYCSAAILVKYARDISEPFILYPLDYGQPFPWGDIEVGEQVYMVDFSLQPYEDMEKLRRICGDNFTWIDHHTTAINTSNGWTPINGHRVVGMAACELTWKYLYPHTPMPDAVEYLGRWDVWDHEDPKVEEFQLGIKSYEKYKDPSDINWSRLFSGDDSAIGNILKVGRVIKDYLQVSSASKAKAICFSGEFGGLRVLAANTGPTNSKFFESLWDGEKYDAMMAFYWNPQIDKWRASLYTSHEHIDVSAVAKKFEGGGHKGAAGFQYTGDLLETITNKEKIS